MRIALLPTGRTEWVGLPRSLARLFPGHEIYVLPEEPLFRSLGGPYPGFTSSRVRANLPSEPAEALIELAAQEALGDRNGHRPAADLVVILDDLELANKDQPEVVTQVLRNAARAHLEALAQHASQSTKDLAHKLGQTIGLPLQLRPTSTSLGARPQHHVLRNL